MISILGKKKSKKVEYIYIKEVTMLNTPKWIINCLQSDGFCCPHCKTRFNPNDIKACGIRLSFRNEKKHVVYVEYHCSECEKQPTLLELYDMEFEEFAYSVFDDESHDTEGSGYIEKFSSDAKKGKKERPNKIPRKTRASKISNKEVKDMKKILNQSDSHYDFLMALGMSPEDLTEYDKIQE